MEPLRNLRFTKSYIWFPLFILYLLIAKSNFATDLKFGNIITPGSFIYVDEPAEIEFEVDNINILTARNYKCFVNIKDIWSTTVFETTLEGKNLKPFSKDTLTALDIWTPTLTGKYNMSIRLDFSEDIDTTNNRTSKDFHVIFSRNQAASWLKYQIPMFSQDTSNTWAFMPQEPLSPGDSIQSYDFREFSLRLDSFKYLGWVDFDKYARYAHPGKVVIIDAEDSTDIDTYDTNYWLLINGTNYLPGFYNKLITEDRIFGSIPEPDSISDASTISDQTATHVTGDSICAVLVSGTGNDSSEQTAFDFDLELMAENLTKEKFGPRLPPSNIKKMPNASKQEICDQLESMFGNYKEIYFYYSGHGWKGGMVTRDSILDQMSYLTLANKLYDTKAKKLNVITDACYSGTAKTSFEIPFDLRNHDLTLITSCSEDTLSYTRYLHTLSNGETIRVGAYTWFLMLCWGQPDANQDSVSEISLKESFDWVKVQNPSLNRGPVNEVMNPQLFIHRAVSPKPVVINPPDTDLSIYQEIPLDTSARVSVKMQTGIDEVIYEDETVNALISKYRYWTLEAEPKDYNFNLRLEFKYNIELDNLHIAPSLGSKPELFMRDSTGSAWKIHAPTKWDSTKMTITGFDVDKFGDWAVGTIWEDTNISKSEAYIRFDYILEQNYPNPFNSVTTIVFYLPNTEFITLKVYDVMSREVAVLLNGKLPAGPYKVCFDTSQLPSGIYFYKMQAADFSDTKKMLMIK